ncbi:pyridoxine/pyridoxal/pyridoxamine kinase [Paenibacillus sp. UMB4589-SE434]|uniref:pyridoxine/pyridoxal/pyridoxamine kinase n=1 Tax=Paenibacillus sp. UMB4589-SE434 TaxID=3046314 RepID=UPI00254DC069|nr:pyridoxine/pyridoxal/pyridoxamine kinase [Paenibacillus sp. UMB4589-SE434]MDK8183570.1 pyridoxine/pyridoxal/pyridoxamine kinase [Paenibacillus sp. UMB4589-SE434]
MKPINKVLTLAGSDSSGGAGIQADLKTFQERGVYGMTALTTIVAMDPDDQWAHRVFPIALSTVEEQLKTILSVGIQGMKTGMLGSIDIIELAARTIEKHKITNVVVDPVMICKGADEALHPETNEALRDVLVPKATVVTPNLFEAAQLAGTAPIHTLEDMKQAAVRIHEQGAKYVLVKGGSKIGLPTSIDVLYDGRVFEILEADLIDTTYTHGAGCTYSAAIAAELAKGYDVVASIRTAKRFITEAIRYSFPLNQYVGPLRHNGLRLVESGSEE